MMRAVGEQLRVYLHRDRGHRFEELQNCVKNDRSVDAAGRQRFDLTPPAGLPPPPAD